MFEAALRAKAEMVFPTRSGSARRRKSTAGFAYLLLLALLAAIGMAATLAVQLGVAAARRDAEQALLTVGEEIESALRDYRQVHGAGPMALDELLLDMRMGGTRRYLRKLYADPLTGRTDWGVVRSPDGSVACVHSRSEGIPFKQGGFALRHRHFADATSYSAWCFGRR